DYNALSLLVFILRKTGRIEEAFSVLNEIIMKDPTNIIAQTELYFLRSIKNNDTLIKKEFLKINLRRDVQYFIEAATFYSNLNFHNDAIDVLLNAIDEFEGSNEVYPIIYYYLGYCYERVG